MVKSVNKRCLVHLPIKIEQPYVYRPVRRSLCAWRLDLVAKGSEVNFIRFMKDELNWQLNLPCVDIEECAEYHYSKPGYGIYKPQKANQPVWVNNESMSKDIVEVDKSIAEDVMCQEIAIENVEKVAVNALNENVTKSKKTLIEKSRISLKSPTPRQSSKRGLTLMQFMGTKM